MRFLLDTHVLLWFLKGETRLPKAIRKKIEDATDVFISSATILEICIKTKSKKLEVDIPQLIQAMQDNDFTELPITTQHALAIFHLPNHHKDPFDQFLIAQAISEPLILLTADAHLKKYTDLVHVVDV